MNRNQRSIIRRVSLSVLLPFLALAAGGCVAGGSSSDITYSRATQADMDFERGAQRAPIPETLYGVGRILVAQGRDGEAEPILTRVVNEHPRFAPAYAELAEVYMRSQRLGKAVTTLEAGLKIAPDDATMLNNLGMCWMLRERYDLALEYFTQAAANAPDDVRMRGNMAAAMGMKGRYDEAFALYEQVVTRAQAHFNLGVLAEARGDHVRAEVEFATARRFNPQVVETRR